MSFFSITDEISGVSQKIRAAIKTKLMDLGVCVDEELPDYVMVMIANKRSKEQMNEDLNLFLGSNTSNFTTWLSDLLHRIQSVTADGSAKSKAGDSICSEERDQSKVSTSSSQSSLSSERSEAAKKVIKQPKSKINRPQIELFSKGNDTITTTSGSEQEDVLALKAELEDDLFEEELKQEPSVPKVKLPNHNLKQDENKILSSSSTRRKIVRVQPAAQITEKRRGPLSTIGAVVQRPVEIEQEYDPTNPSIGKVASIVKVSERKSSVPKSKQANKNLLIKAMREAQESVTENPKKNSNSTLRIEPFITTEADLADVVNTTAIPRVEHSRLVVGEDTLKNELERELDRETTHLIPEKVQLNDLRTNRSRFVLKGNKIERKPILFEEPVGMDTREDILIESPKPRNTSFVITLNGVNDRDFSKVAKKRSYQDFSESYEDNVDVDEEESDEAEELESEYDSDEYMNEKKMKMPERCKFWPACKNGDDCEFHHPNTSCRKFPKCKFGDKCLYIHPNCKYDAKCTKEDCPYTHASKRSLNSSSTTSAPDSSVDLSDVTCKFFPNCTKLSCPFKHVKVCRYSFNCKRPDCSFTHPALPSPDKLKWTALEKPDELQKEGVY